MKKILTSFLVSIPLLSFAQVGGFNPDLYFRMQINEAVTGGGSQIIQRKEKEEKPPAEIVDASFYKRIFNEYQIESHPESLGVQERDQVYKAMNEVDSIFVKANAQMAGMWLELDAERRAKFEAMKAESTTENEKEMLNLMEIHADRQWHHAHDNLSKKGAADAYLDNFSNTNLLDLEVYLHEEEFDELKAKLSEEEIARLSIKKDTMAKLMNDRMSSYREEGRKVNEEVAYKLALALREDVSLLSKIKRAVDTNFEDFSAKVKEKSEELADEVKKSSLIEFRRNSRAVRNLDTEKDDLELIKESLRKKESEEGKIEGSEELKGAIEALELEIAKARQKRDLISIHTYTEKSQLLSFMKAIGGYTNEGISFFLDSTLSTSLENAKAYTKKIEVSENVETQATPIAEVDEATLTNLMDSPQALLVYVAENLKCDEAAIPQDVVLTEEQRTTLVDSFEQVQKLCITYQHENRQIMPEDLASELQNLQNICPVVKYFVRVYTEQGDDGAIAALGGWWSGGRRGLALQKSGGGLLRCIENYEKKMGSLSSVLEESFNLLKVGPMITLAPAFQEDCETSYLPYGTGGDLKFMRDVEAVIYRMSLEDLDEMI